MSGIARVKKHHLGRTFENVWPTWRKPLLSKLFKWLLTRETPVKITDEELNSAIPGKFQTVL